MARSKYLISMLMATTVCFILHISISQEIPGMQVQIGKAGLDYANEMCLNKMYEEFKSYTFETYSKDYYTLFNVKINDVSMPTGDVTFIPGRGLRWYISSERYKLSADVKFNKTILLVEKGYTVSLNMDISLLSLQLRLEATKTSNGGLSLKAVNCESQVAVQVSSSQIFVKKALPFVRSKINTLLENKLCASAIKIVNNNVAPTFSNFPLIRRLQNGYVFDYRFVSDPVFTHTYMQTKHKAAVMAKNQTSDFTFSPKLLPKVYTDRYMIWFTISNFVLNTWLYNSYRDGKFKLNVTKEKFKTEKQRNMLQTNCSKSFCIATFYPKVLKDYPNGTVEIFFSAIRAPTVQFTLKKMYLEADVLSKFNVLTSDGKSVNFLSSNLVLTSELGAKITGLNILFSVTTSTFKVNTLSCVQPADLDSGLLEKYLDLVANMLKPNVPAIPLPLTLPSNTILRNANLGTMQDALLLASNLTILPI